MKLDVSGMRYLTKEHFKVLTAVELGMKNHEIVPVELISSIAKLRHGGVAKILSHLLRNKLIAHDGTTYDGFKLTYMGYDFLALKVFMKHGHIAGLGRQIGVGKESDIYMAVQPDGTEVAIKFHRLGRTSFRAVKNDAYDACMNILVRLAECGLVHCDFNEFNIMMDGDGKITIIDFPQMISTKHLNAQELFNRDVNGLVKFFSRLQNGAYMPDEVPQLDDIVRDLTVSLDTQVQASGYTEDMALELDQVVLDNIGEEDERDDENSDQGDGDDSDEEIDPTLAKELQERIDALTSRTDDQTVLAHNETSGSDDDDDDEEEDVTLTAKVPNEHVRKQVKKTLTKQQQKGSSRRSRNSSKLSVKGKLVHQRDM
ncbi:hypothetical protein DYB25_000449 [Aphanomyces astaci]|uniref:non-specific serine/threonine protein kinase n=1 Tax=Aphanomyces astaci TaxID=112090 RepID=A0A397DIC5_APHAT|nr:hypothetical protein DYB25_000449 [Aphanomyces astaci]RHY37905.1 hypothetical protein DYB34_002379 [Aphanomyces astaci]RHY62626.1 hypothetical protein DYB30_000098 [Aphanomyces astaci]